jgi:hypothetical protein
VTATAGEPPPTLETDVDLSDELPPIRSARPWAVRIAVVALLLAMGVQMALAALHDTATYDEPVNVRAGMVYALDHDLTPNAEHPPLTKLLSGLSVRLLRPDPKGDLRSFEVIYFPKAPKYGKRALATDERAQAAIRAARVPLIILTLLFGLVVYCFARDLFGRVAGVVSLAAYALAPELIGHGHLATNDLPAAGFLVTALWCVLRVSRAVERRARIGWLVGAGLALGAGLSTKYQVLLYAPAVVVAVLWVAWRSLPPEATRHERTGRLLRWGGLVTLLALAVPWALTAAIDPSALLHAPPTGFGEGDHSFIARLIGWLPLPAVYRAGLRYQNEYSRVPKVAFLQGDAYWGHRFWYQPLVLSMKFPVATLALWATGLVVALRRRRWLVAVLVAIPAALVLGLGMFKGSDIGDRYVIGTPILLAVVAGAVFAPGVVPWLRGRHRWIAAGAAIAVLAVSAWGARGHEIAYVSPLWGGTSHGYELMSDSAVDWGQDLSRLAAWAKAHPEQTTFVDYFGTSALDTYGGDLVPVDAYQAGRVESGTIAVSVTEYNRNRPTLEGLGPPFHQIGSILLFHPRPDSAAPLPDQKRSSSSSAPGTSRSQRSRQSSHR